jgi:predicted nucleotidyltransferase
LHQPYLVEKYGVKIVGVFGSYVRHEQLPDSDLDLLIELDPPPKISLIGLVELEEFLTMLFAGVRDSTSLAEQMSALQFSQLINRFYLVATDVLVRTDAFVDRLIGDQVIGLYIPGKAGSQHPLQAIQAAQNLLHNTGHSDPHGPWIPIGVGVHTDLAFVGIVGWHRGQLNIITFFP